MTDDRSLSWFHIACSHFCIYESFVLNIDWDTWNIEMSLSSHQQSSALIFLLLTFLTSGRRARLSRLSLGRWRRTDNAFSPFTDIADDAHDIGWEVERKIRQLFRIVFFSSSRWSQEKRCQLLLDRLGKIFSPRGSEFSVSSFADLSSFWRLLKPQNDF